MMKKAPAASKIGTIWDGKYRGLIFGLHFHIQPSRVSSVSELSGVTVIYTRPENDISCILPARLSEET